MGVKLWSWFVNEPLKWWCIRLWSNQLQFFLLLPLSSSPEFCVFWLWPLILPLSYWSFRSIKCDFLGFVNDKSSSNRFFLFPKFSTLGIWVSQGFFVLIYTRDLTQCFFFFQGKGKFFLFFFFNLIYRFFF